jgi:PDZ domain-containing protein
MSIIDRSAPPPEETFDDGGPAPGPPGGEERRRRWSWWFLLAPVLVLAFVLSVVRIPYFVVSPGPAEDVFPRIHVSGHPTYQPNGHLLLTSVYESPRQVNVYQALWAWIDPASAVVPEREILPPGQTPEQNIKVQVTEMDTSKIDAAYVALSQYAGYPSKHGRGVLVERVVPGTPAEGKLLTGYVILAVGGKPVADPDELGKQIRAAGRGPVLFSVRSPERNRGRPFDVTITPGRVPGLSHPGIGIGSVPNFPFPLRIDSGDIGGPSAGLMWTIGLADLLTPGNLTGGRTIAGTGAIELDGRVDPIGGVEEKVVAAERAGARVFIVPAQNAAAARSAAHDIIIVPVKTFRDAISYLERHP